MLAGDGGEGAEAGETDIDEQEEESEDAYASVPVPEDGMESANGE